MTSKNRLVGPDPTSLWWRALRLSAALGCFLLSIILSPLLLLFYSCCAARAGLTSCVLARRGMKFVGGPDSMAGQEAAAIIHVLVTMRDRIDLDALRKLTLEVVQRTNENGKLRYPNMSRYAVRRAGYMVWKMQKHFRIEDHVKRWPTKRHPQSDAELAHYASEASNAVMPEGRSMWQMLVLDCDYEPGKGVGRQPTPTCAVLFRVHHTITDGVALLRLVMEELVGSNAHIQQAIRQRQVRAGRPQSRVSRAAVKLTRFVAALLFAPYIQFRQLAEADSNAMHGPKLSGRRLVGWSKPIPLASVKAVKNATASTVNDVLMTCVAGGLRRFLLKRGLSVPDVMHSVVPVNLTPLDSPLDLGNSLSFVVAALATGETDAMSRLRATKLRMDDLKVSPDVIVNGWIMRSMYNVLPLGITDLGGRMTPMSLVLSNVPGPGEVASICGSPMIRIVPVVPIMGKLGLTVCVFSYCGELTISTCVDTGIIDSHAGIKELMRGFHEEMHELISCVRL